MRPSLCLFLLTTIVFASCQKPVDAEIFIENVTIIDPESGHIPNQSVLIVEDKIIRIFGQDDRVKVSARIHIDGTDRFLIPGLWDAHVHMAYENDLAPSMFDLFLVNGITSIRDTGGLLHLVKPWKKLSLENPRTTPRLMIAGPLIDGFPTVYDGNGRPALAVTAQTPASADSLVRLMATEGTDLLKSYEMLTPESYEALLMAAAEVNLPVTGHVPLSMDVISASKLGLRSMEHLRNLEFSTSEDSDSLLQVRRSLLQEGLSESGGSLRSSIHSAQRHHSVKTTSQSAVEEVLSALRENGTWQVPTLSISTANSKRHFSREEWKKYFRYLPDSVESRWRKNLIGFEKNEIAQSSIDYADWVLWIIGELDKNGVEIMAGTDTPIFFLTPGYSLHEELALLVEGGLSPRQALRSATLLPAEYFGLEKQLGRVQVNYLADLVLLSQDPLEDIRNTRSIEAVIKSGNLMARKDLDEKLAQLDSK